MERLLALFALALGALALPTTVAAQSDTTARTIATERWVEEWDPASQRWVRVSASPSEAIAKGQVTSVSKTHIVNGVVVEQSQNALPGTQQTARYALPVARPQASARIAQYGPFRVIDGKRAAVVGSTDQSSPAFFDAMLRDFPELEVLELVEAPGTRHDIANLKVGRKIRAAGLRTHVPTGGSVRSGAVELFLAGSVQTMDQGAQFAVHSWRDAYGRQPQDFPEDHPANRLYIDYYMEMGMTEREARAFYAMTNSVPHSSALWLSDKEMRGWVAGSAKPVPAQRAVALMDVKLPVSVSKTDALELLNLDVDHQVAMIALPDAVAAPNITSSIAPSIAYADVSAMPMPRVM